MSNLRDQLPSGRALWALLWRSIVFFPLGLVIYLLYVAVGVAVLAPFCALATWAVAFGLMQRWWEAAGCALAFAILALVWRACVTRADRRHLRVPAARPPGTPEGGGDLFFTL